MNIISPYNLTPYGGNAGAAGSVNSKYIEFGGTDEYLSMPPFLALGTTHTINWWFKFGTGWNIVLGDLSAGNKIVAINSATNNFYYYSNTGESSVSYITDTDWHMGTITRLNTAINFYIDTVQVGTEQTLTDNSVLSIQHIGRFGSGGGYNGAGTALDEIYVNTGVLSSSDITTLYGGGTPQTAGDPLSLSNGLFYVNFEADIIPTVTDLIGSVVLTAQNMESADIKSY